MGFTNQKDYEIFLREVPAFEKILVENGINLIKFYFSISKEEQAERFHDRRVNPLKQFKLSPVDQSSQQLWDRYTLAEYNNFSFSDTKFAPWTIIESNDKKSARLNAMRYLLGQFEYPAKSKNKSLKEIDWDIVLTGKQKLKELEKEVNKKILLFE